MLLELQMLSWSWVDKSIQLGGGGEGLAFYLYLFKEGLKSFVLLKTFAKDFLSNASEKYLWPTSETA